MQGKQSRPTITYRHQNVSQNHMVTHKGKKYKGKVVPVHAMKTYRGRRGTAPFIVNFGTRLS